MSIFPDPWRRVVHVGQVPGMPVDRDGKIHFRASGDDSDEWMVWDPNAFFIDAAQHIGHRLSITEYLDWLQTYHPVSGCDFSTTLTHESGDSIITHYKQRTATPAEIAFLQAVMAFEAMLPKPAHSGVVASSPSA